MGSETGKTTYDSNTVSGMPVVERNVSLMRIRVAQRASISRQSQHTLWGEAIKVKPLTRESRRERLVETHLPDRPEVCG